jgi:hypothetical protein
MGASVPARGKTMQDDRERVKSVRDPNSRLGRLRILLRFIVLGAGGIHVWAAIASNSMNEDGINYLDIGDAYFMGDWHAALSSVWSPMYSWVLGFVMWIARPAMEWEFALVHLVNFMIYVISMLSFEFFWRQITRYHRGDMDFGSENNGVGLPDWAILTLGYLIFSIGSLQLINIWAVTPDLLMSVFVYLAAGIILRLRSGDMSLINFVLLGLVLGFGYLAKSVMFPMAFVFLVVSFFSIRAKRHAALGVGLALFLFLIVAAPYVALISNAKGKVTFGDAGKLTYAKHVNYVQYPHWQGDSEGNGTPEHPSRKILDSPPIYEFGEPIAGTYPISHDPAYWYEGVVARFDFKNQLNAFLASVQFYADLLFLQHGGLLFGIVVLQWFGSRRPRKATDIFLRWGLIFPSVAAFWLYGLIVVAGRYIGAFVVLFWSELLANVRLPDTQSHKKLVSVVSWVMILFLFMSIAAFNLDGFRRLTGGKVKDPLTVKQVRSPSWHGEVAHELYRLGLQRGDSAAVIGYAFDSYWARLGRIRIVAEMFGWQADPFWFGSNDFQAMVIDVFRSTGADAVVAENVPTHARLEGWHRVSDTDYYVYVFKEK